MNTVHAYLLGMGAINRDVTTGMLFDLTPSIGRQAETRIDKKDLGPISGEGPPASVPC